MIEQVTEPGSAISVAPGIKRGDFPAQLEPGALVRLAVWRRCARRDRREQGPDVGACHKPAAAGRPRPPRRAHIARSSTSPSSAVGSSMKALVAPSAQAPMGPRQRHDRPPDLGGRRSLPLARSVQHQFLDPVRVLCRDRRRELTALRGPEQAEDRRPPRRPPPAPRPPARRTTGRSPSQSDGRAPGVVITDDGGPLGQPPDEGAEGVRLQLRAQVGDPARVAKRRPAQAPVVE